MTPWFIFALISVACSITYGLVSKKLLNNKDDLDPIAYASVLFSVVALISLIVYAFSGANLQSDLAGFSNPQALLFLAANTLFYSFAPSLYWRAFKKLPASEVSVMYDLTTVYIFIFGVYFGVEVFSATRMAGGALIVGAVLLLTFVTAQGNHFQKNKYVGMLLFSTILYALAALTDNIIISQGYFSPLFFQFLCFGLPALILLILNPKAVPNLKKIVQPKMLKYLLFNGLFFFGSFWAIYAAYDAGGVTSEVNFVLATETILTVIFATIFLRERQHIPVKIVCAVLASIGIWMLI